MCQHSSNTSLTVLFLLIFCMPFWIDTHCHLDAAEFLPDVASAARAPLSQGVVIGSAAGGSGEQLAAVCLLAHEFSDSYALGIHPLGAPDAQEADLQTLDAELTLRNPICAWWPWAKSGWIILCRRAASPMRERQEFFYRAQPAGAQARVAGHSA